MGLKKLIKGALVQFSRLSCPRNVIVLESTPDFSDNTFAVYQELLRQGYGECYTLVWSCGKKRKLKDAPACVRYIYPMDRSLWQRLRNFAYLSAAKCLICCNRYLVPKHAGQTAFYLTHGSPLKSVCGYNPMPEQIHYCLSASKGMEDVTARELMVEPSKMFSLGYPRNDVLTQPPIPIREILDTQCKKVIVWYPTFRQHQNGAKISAGNALPIIHDADAAQALNDWAKQMDVLLVMKPHFAQDLRYIKDLGLSNIRFIDDAFFREHGITSYAFVAGCDALLTDYSSIYFDYLLCDKPVGLIWEDIDEYRQNPGFALDIDAFGQGAVKIYTLSEFKQFIRDVAEGIDSCCDRRQVLCDLVNHSRDGKNAQRVVQFIAQKARL